MPNTASDCTDAILAYAREVASAVSNGNATIVAVADEKWQRGPDSVARRQQVARRFVQLDAHAASSALYEVACRAVGHDPDFGPQIGGMIGGTMGMSPFDERAVIHHAVRSSISTDGTPILDEDALKQAVEGLRTYVMARERKSIVVIPLPGLQSSMFPFQLEDGLEIDVLTDDEIDWSAKAGVLQPIFPGTPFLSADECVGVRIALSTPAMKSAPGTQPQFSSFETALGSAHRFGDRSPWHLGELVEDVLFVLRLARPEFIGTRGALLIDKGVTGTSQRWNARATRQMLHTSYVIDDQAAADIQELWNLLRSHGGRRSLPPICLRRFNAAIDRISQEDAIVDYLIAAEALFLKDAGGPEERGELGFRLAMRAAAFMESEGHRVRSTAKFMRRAYELRSGIAHGGSAPQEVDVPERGKVPLAQFIDELGQLMRDALKKAVAEYGRRPNFATSEFWDELVLGPPEVDRGDGSSKPPSTD